MTGARFKIFLLSALGVMIVTFFVFLKNGGIAEKRIPGSFEYARRAEGFLDKGMYAQAIDYFEKAYRSSPENKYIRDSLIYAYSRYAQTLAGAEKYDEAIRFMEKAQQIAYNTYTTQNLALTYAKKALSDIGRRDWFGATDSLVKARMVAEGSDKASKALSVALHNDALEEYKAGRDTSAILLLKQAALAHEDSRVYSLLGDVYYKRNDLASAEFYFSKAFRLDAANKEIAERLRKVRDEEALSKSKQLHRLPHFDIRLEKDVPADIGFIGSVLERAYLDIGGDLDYYPDQKTAVFFYSTQNFKNIFKMPNIVRAFYDGNMRIPLPDGSSDKNELASFLYHEYTHAVLSAKTKNNCPAWLGEGIAVWEEIKWTRPGMVINLTEKVLGGRDISVRLLENAFRDDAAAKPDIALYYVLAYTLVEYIVDEWGLPGLRDILSKIAGGQHAVNAIDDAFLMSEKEFERRWGAFVENKYLKKGG
ncbi:MAG: peptidase MA family metallohydrolase [Candidatus Omnitrophica bacterium]|nr:peptidase MA family metallohydrolase [Candidatus Omnitrophota bacterium]